jgi:hypothetical protein
VKGMVPLAATAAYRYAQQAEQEKTTARRWNETLEVSSRVDVDHRSVTDTQNKSKSGGLCS